MISDGVESCIIKRGDLCLRTFLFRLQVIPHSTKEIIDIGSLDFLLKRSEYLLSQYFEAFNLHDIGIPFEKDNQ